MVEDLTVIGAFWPVSDGVNDVLMIFAPSLTSETYLIPKLVGDWASVQEVL